MKRACWPDVVSLHHDGNPGLHEGHTENFGLTFAIRHINSNSNSRRCSCPSRQTLIVGISTSRYVLLSQDFSYSVYYFM